MDDLDEAGELKPANIGKGLEGAGDVSGGVECPNCGGRFPSKESLDEHLASHKRAQCCTAARAAPRLFDSQGTRKLSR